MVFGKLSKDTFALVTTFLAVFLGLFILGYLIAEYFKEPNVINKYSNKSTEEVGTAGVEVGKRKPRTEILNKKIAYIRGGDVWLSNDDGRNQRKITSDESITSFRWLKNSSQFVYYSVFENLREIKIIDWETQEVNTIHKTIIDMSKEQEGLPDDIQWYLHSLSVSPDATKIALGGSIIYPADGFVVYDINSKKETKYSNCGDSPVFSNDGGIVASVVGGNIIICNLSEGNPIKITNFPVPKGEEDFSVSHVRPSYVLGWSPDDIKIYYVVSNVGRGNVERNTVNNIESVEVQTGEVEHITDYAPGRYVEPLEFDSTQTAIFVTDINRLHQSTSLGESEPVKAISEIDLNNREHYPIAVLEDTYSKYSYTVSADGKIILYESSIGQGKTGIWQLIPGKTEDILLIEDGESPVWVY